MTVPNFVARGGLSLRFPIAELGIGKRADYFIGGPEVGADAAKARTNHFYRPFGTTSVGLV